MNMLRAAATVSGLTLMSRITGLVREMITAALFGASAMTDAFFVAFRLPNLLRRLFAEGAFSQAFIPMLARHRPLGDGEAASQVNARRFIDAVASALFWSLALITALGVLSAPVLVWLMASGLADTPDALSAAVVMTRLMFPYILLISLAALAAGILNTWQRFAIPAFTPVLLNLSMIGAASLLSPHVDPPVLALAAGVMVGGMAQLGLQAWALYRLGLLPRIALNPFRSFAHPDARQVLARMAPAVLAVSVAQISLMINTHIASRLAPGSVSWINYGDRLMEFPTALLGVALGTVLLPSLARAGERGDHAGYSELLDWGLRLTVALALPAMVGLALMAEPLTALLYHYGRFEAHDVTMTARAVQAYALGLLGLIAIKVLAPGFYARHDVRTPVRIALLVLVATQLMNIAFVPWLDHAGLALSISVAAWINAGLLMRGLLKNGAWRPSNGWAAWGGKVLSASLAMAGLLAALAPRIDWLTLADSPLSRAGLALGLVAAAAAVYFGSLGLMGVRPRDFRRSTA
ncbi:MAG: integral rane protein MviN [Pseudomonadota bacterium]|jgi:putative peptidoglycan lipid II flippase